MNAMMMLGYRYQWIVMIFLAVGLTLWNTTEVYSASAKSASPKTPASASPELARMGKVTLSVAEFQSLMNYSDKEVKRQLLANPELMKQKIGEFIIRKFVVATAKEEKLDKKAAIAFTLERATEGVLFDKYLDSVVKLPANFPEDSMVQKAYQENQSKFMDPPMVNIAQIFLKFDEKMDDKAKQELFKQAEQYASMIQSKKADMATLARKYSQHPLSADKGGDMGWMTPAQLMPEFRKVLEGMKAGEVKGPVKSAQGVHIFQLLASKDAAPTPFEKVRGSLVQVLKNKKSQELKDLYLMELIKKQTISITEENRMLLK
ncbi:MAG: peptidylprolyl isomerase [Magnetococcales bacterium]|nr:peptidylprolyl isomerase [Magnetococcales bacterium]